LCQTWSSPRSVRAMAANQSVPLHTVVARARASARR
jgi:hypothetical protein